MNFFRLAALGLCLLLGPLGAAAQTSVNDRLNRLERTIGSSSLLQMLDTLQELKREVRQLRGEVEVQTNKVRKLESLQREMYQDLSQRIQAGGSGAAVAAAPPAAETQTAATAAAAQVPVPPATAAPQQETSGPSGGEQAAGDPAAEQADYRAAFDFLKSGNYNRASRAFSEFISTYPSGRFSDNAQYWLGESYYVTREFDPALSAFERLIADFPDSSKRGHALLKIGFIYDETGRKDEARRVLKELVAENPSSTAAGLARKRLARLQ